MNWACLCLSLGPCPLTNSLLERLIDLPVTHRTFLMSGNTTVLFEVNDFSILVSIISNKQGRTKKCQRYREMGRKVNQNNLSIPEQTLCVGDDWLIKQ